jgi:hypothetical protein
MNDAKYFTRPVPCATGSKHNNAEEGRTEWIKVDAFNEKLLLDDGWKYHPDTGCWRPIDRGDGTQTTELLHRMVAGARRKELVRFIDGDKTNCVISNLMITNRAELNREQANKRRANASNGDLKRPARRPQAVSKQLHEEQADEWRKLVVRLAGTDPGIVIIEAWQTAQAYMLCQMVESVLPLLSDEQVSIFLRRTLARIEQSREGVIHVLSD